MREEYGKLNGMEMSIWECCELLNSVVDESDPDLDEPQIEHPLQTAEAIRKDYPNEDWLHLTALIHGIFLSRLFVCFVWLVLIFGILRKCRISLILLESQILERFSIFLLLGSFLNGLLLVSISFPFTHFT